MTSSLLISSGQSMGTSHQTNRLRVVTPVALRALMDSVTADGIQSATATVRDHVEQSDTFMLCVVCRIAAAIRNA